MLLHSHMQAGELARIHPQITPISQIKFKWFF